MKRREFIAHAGAVAALWPLAAGAQQSEHMRRVGILMGAVEADPEYQDRLKAFRESLASLGWREETNIHLDVRWGFNDADIHKGAVELIGLSPDVVLTNAPPSIIEMQKLTRTIPIVFAAVTDPVLLGLVDSLAHPGGNITGFATAEVALSGKWLELLKDMAPDVKHVGVIAPPSNVGAQAQIGAIQAAASSLNVELSRLTLGEPIELERGVGALAKTANGGLIASRTVEAFRARDLIVSLAAKYHLPAVCPDRVFVRSGGLASYGPDITGDFRRAAGYVDRILKGEKPGDLPVQVPTKYQLVINLKTAKTLGLTVPAALLSTADEVIE